MGANWKMVDVLCPFYKSDETLGNRRTFVISCEGIGDSATCRLQFDDKKAKETQLSTFCMQHFQNCELYRAIAEKYE